MGDEREIYRVEMDVSDFQRKAEAIEKKLAEIDRARQAGKDTSELEAGLAKEVEGLAKLGRKNQEAAGSTEELLRQKEKLGAVVRTLGADFSGMVGDLGGVVELLVSGSKAAVAFGGALAGLTAVMSIIGAIKRQMQELVAEQERAAQRLADIKAGLTEQQAAMAETLQRFGGLTKDTEGQAARLAKRLQAAGFSQGQAQAVAPLAVLAGMGEEDAKVAAQLVAMGQSPASPKELAAAVARAKASAQYPAIQRQIAELVQTQTGRMRADVARATPTTGAVQASAEERAYRKAVAAGVIGNDVSFGEFKKRVEQARRLAAAEKQLKSGEVSHILQMDIYGPEGGSFGWWNDTRWMGLFEVERDLGMGGRRQLLKMVRNEESRRGIVPAPNFDAPPPQVINVGTVHLTPDASVRPTPPWGRRGQGPTGPLIEEPIIP